VCPPHASLYPNAAASLFGVRKCNTAFRSHNAQAYPSATWSRALGSNLELSGGDRFGAASESSKRIAGILFELRNVDVLHIAGFAIR